MPYTAHWTPPPFCRVRLYRNMVSYFVARATRRTLNRLRLPLAPTSVARLAMISPWGLAQRINQSTRVLQAAIFLNCEAVSFGFQGKLASLPRRRN